jgi:prepilin-type N-terminal cleavage/methylation domain-containing protein
MQKSFQTNKTMRKHKVNGFTLVELLVVIAVIALLMAILLPALTKAKEQGKRAVCLTHIKQLQLAWNMYCDANNEKVPVGDVGYSWTFPSNYQGGPQLSWHEWPHNLHPGVPPGCSPLTNWCSCGGSCSPGTGPTLSYQAAIIAEDEIWWHAIEEGTLWKYIKDHRVYKCPVGEKGNRITYTMAHSMNTFPGSAGPGSVSRTITLRNQIKRTAERIVFIDAGQIKAGAFYVVYNVGGINSNPPGKWYDKAFRHGDGTVFCFTDNHAEYKKWTDPHTLAEKELDWGAGTQDLCDCDIRWITKATWGDVPYVCGTAGKCDE